MQIAIIHGSPRKNGNTHTAARKFMDGMRRMGDVSFQEFYLPDALPEFCRGCMTCVLRGEDKCPHSTDTLPVLDAILRADGLIFTTPVYVMAESGAMKNFLDHFPYLYFVHRPRAEMFGKKAFVLSTALGAGLKKSIAPIATSLKFWGVNRVYTAGFSLHEVEWTRIPPKRRARIEREIARLSQKFYREVSSRKRHAPYPFLWFLLLFLRRMIAGYPEDSLDKNYWLQKGWLQKSPFRSREDGLMP